MIDVDSFKNYNDYHGHLAGDLVARYGGEEFVALLTSNTREGTLHVAERMRQRVAELRILHGHSSVSSHVTVSLGVASQMAGTESDPMDLLRKADQPTYLAKTRGRDRVEAAEE